MLDAKHVRGINEDLNEPQEKSSTTKSLQEMRDSLSSVLSAATLWRSLENYHTPYGPCKK